MKHTTTIFLCCFLFRIASAQFCYINPVPGSQYQNPQTNIILKNGSIIDEATLADKNLIEIKGSSSGYHKWMARLSDDHKSVIIKPELAFNCGEKVDVIVHPGIKKSSGEQIEGTSFYFKIREQLTPEIQDIYRRNGLASHSDGIDFGASVTMNEKITYPLDSMPTYTINVNNNPANGRIFYRNHKDQLTEVPTTNCFPTIIENDGTIVWAKNLDHDGLDFKLNENGFLTYFADTAKWIVLDSNYNIVDSLQCKNGYELETQGHDMIMYPDGHVFLMAYDVQTVDMTPYGGVSNAKVQGLVIQELDANRDVVFEWRSWDHFLFTDANSHTPLTNALVDYVHGNSVERDFDGNVLISSRNMDELTKIDHATGNIIWRMGGENNQFTFVNDNIPQHFSSQHDLRRIPNGHITIFNNGNYLNPLISSAKEYALDEVNKVATLVWYYEHPDVGGVHVYGGATGNAQRLPNGNTMIDWGIVAAGIPNQTEVDNNKNITWEMTFDSPLQKSYRVHKYQWNPCARITGYTMHLLPNPQKTILSWGPATGATSYRVQYRQLGSTTWKNKTTTPPRVKLNDLLPSTAYEWRVQTRCSNLPTQASVYSVIDTFISPTLKNEIAEAFNQDLFVIYPVPASNQLSIQLYGTLSSINIMNLMGQEMFKSDVPSATGKSIQVDVQQWPAGIYIVEGTDGTISCTRKIIVE